MSVTSSSQKNTSLAGKNVIDSIGFGATTGTIDEFLEWRADLYTITNNLTSKLMFEKFKTSKPALKSMVTKEKMMNRYKKRNKHTGTSPSGRHLGHSRALFWSFIYDINNEGDKAELKEKKELIFEVHFMMLHISAVDSHVYACWKNIITCMIEKDLGSAKNYCLQVINLYEWILNLLLRLYKREMDQHCKDNHLPNKGSYGGPPGRRSINPVIIYVPQLEIAMITQRILLRFNNDDTACFNQIMPHILCLCLPSY